MAYARVLRFDNFPCIYRIRSSRLCAHVLAFEVELLLTPEFIEDVSLITSGDEWPHPIERYLRQTFEGTLAIDQNDAFADHMYRLKTHGIADPLLFDGGVGPEAFARVVFAWVIAWLESIGYGDDSGVTLSRVRCSEYGGRYGEYFPNGDE